MTLEIHDEQLIRDLQHIAEAENRPIEDILKHLVASYRKKPARILDRKDPQVRDIYLKAYAKARAYWQAQGDPRATLSDDEMDVQFGAFDEEGIPRLKDELPDEPPVGSLAYLAKIIEETGGVTTNNPIDVADMRDILNNEYADYLLSRMNSEEINNE